MTDEYSRLPDSEKRRLCLNLLSEFSVKNLHESGDELIHSCPLPFGLHKNGDRNPSASLNWRKLAFNCLGCGSGGGLLWFIAIMRGTGSTDAKKWLQHQTGVGGVQDLSALMGFLDALENPESPTPQPMPRYDERILEPWRVIHPYLTEIRHIPEDNVVKHRVGFDGESIIIPHWWQGSLVGWQARRLLASSGPKYKSTPEFPKDRTLYNHNPRSAAVIVESPMSVIARSHQCHMEATFGASVTIRQRNLIVQHPEITLFFDNDEAGWKATEQVGEFLMDHTSRLFVVNNPFAADAADLTDDDFDALLADRVPFVIWSRPNDLLPYDRSNNGVHKVRLG